jgi:hypothetical protein
VGSNMTWRSWLSAAAGAWIIIQTFVFHATGNVAAAFAVLGALMILAAIWTALDRPAEDLWRGWMVALFGAALTLSPWLLGLTGDAVETWLTAGVGLVLGVGFGFWSALDTGEPGGGSGTVSTPGSKSA